MVNEISFWSFQPEPRSAWARQVIAVFNPSVGEITSQVLESTLALPGAPVLPPDMSWFVIETFSCM